MHSIRSAEVEDAAAIAHVHVQSWRTTYRGLVPEEYLASLNEAERVPLWQEWLTRDISVFVAEVAGRMSGSPLAVTFVNRSPAMTPSSTRSICSRRYKAAESEGIFCVLLPGR